MKKTIFLIVACLGFLFSACENEDLGEADENTVAVKLPYSIKTVALKDIPDVDLFIKNNIGNILTRSKTGKSSSSLSNTTFDINKIIEVTDTLENKNYSIRFVFDDTPENVFFNLIINVLPTGDKNAFIEKYTCDVPSFPAYKNSQYKFKFFQGKVELFKVNAFFGKGNKTNKISSDPCPPKYYPNGDPIPDASSFVYPSSANGSGGGSTDSGNTSSSYPDLGTGGRGIFVTGGSSDDTSIGTDCCSCGNCGLHWYLPSESGDHQTQKSTVDPCPSIVPIGYIGLAAEPENLQILRAELNISLQQWQWLHGKDAFMDLILTYIYSSNDTINAKSLALEAIDSFMNNPGFSYFDFIKAPFIWSYNGDDGTTFNDLNPLKETYFKFDPADNYETRYPRFTNMVKNLKTFAKNNPKVLKALQDYSGFSKQEVLDRLTFGQGPIIKVEEMYGRYGFYNYAKGINTLHINASYVRGLEQSFLESTQEATAFLLGVTILHEFMHLGNQHNKISEGAFDFGFGFERDAFNIEIDEETAGSVVIKFSKYF